MQTLWARVAGWDRPRFLTLIVVASFLIRLAAVLALRGLGDGPSERHGMDGVRYDALGQSIALGRGFVTDSGAPTSFRAPGFPIVLAALYAPAGRDYRAAHLAFCLLGSAGCVLTYCVARELLPESSARTAAALAVVYPPHVYFATLFDSENLFVPCLALAVWLFLRHVKAAPGGRPLDLAGSGLTLGLATLTRPYSLLMVPIFLAILLRVRVRQARLFVRDATILTAAFGAVVVPWTARNYAVHGRFVLIATNGGSTFYGGNNDRVAREPYNLGGWLATNELPGRDRIDAAPDEVAHDKVEWALGLRWMRDHPATVPRLWACKLLRFWLPDVGTPNRAMIALQVVCGTPFLLLIVAGLARCLRDRRYWSSPWLVVHGVLLATVLTALIFWGSPRFRDAIMPILMVYAVVGLPRRISP